MPCRYPALASAAWILTDASATTPSNFSGICTVSGPSSVVNAYRAELQGIYALLVALETFCIQYQITSGGITIGCDNKGALSQAQWFHKHVPCAVAHADIIRTITAIRLRIHISLTFVYIPGHQDALSRIEDLSPLAHLNIWADTMAKHKLHRLAALPQCPSIPSLLIGEKWRALAPSGKITSDLSQMVMDLLGCREALRYWSHK